jgi:hypothetical protein
MARADDFLGAAKSISRCGVDQIDAALDRGVNRFDRLLIVGSAPHPAANRPGAQPSA